MKEGLEGGSGKPVSAMGFTGGRPPSPSGEEISPYKRFMTI
jgi:hypothetical protein